MNVFNQIYQYFIQGNASELFLKIWQHLYLSLISLSLAIIIALPLSILLQKYHDRCGWILNFVSFLQTIPSLALLALMIPIFGIGKLPAIMALFIYALLPILRNTYSGLDALDPVYLDAGRGMGMSSWQSLYLIELPMAFPVIMAGIRSSAVYVISWASLAGYIGAGGLGDFIFTGLSLYRTDLLLLGSVPISIMALFTDWALGKFERHLTISAV